MKAFVIDINECSGCYCCQMACKDEHCGNDWTPYAKPQPDWGQFWGKMNTYERGQTPQVRVSYIFVPCQHCENASCISACPIEAIYRRDDGLIVIDPKKCTGCRNCLDDNACPYGAIYFNEGINIAQKCTGCAHLIDRDWKEPRCADVCPHLAIKFGEESELDISGTETFHPEYGLTTRVHYNNLPKRFIAGTVYDPGTEEVVIGATCTLTGDGGPYTQTTDNFGDFWFDGLAATDFSLTINGGGKTATKTVSTKDKDIGLGDIALS
jgi:tetrathionate reductase subunit B